MKIKQGKNFVKQFRKLQPKIQRKAVKCLVLFAKNKMSTKLKNHKLKGDYVGCRSINITGDVRAVYEEMGDDTYLFIAIVTHHQLYGK